METRKPGYPTERRRHGFVVEGVCYCRHGLVSFAGNGPYWAEPFCADCERGLSRQRERDNQVRRRAIWSVVVNRGVLWGKFPNLSEAAGIARAINDEVGSVTLVAVHRNGELWAELDRSGEFLRPGGVKAAGNAARKADIFRAMGTAEGFTAVGLSAAWDNYRKLRSGYDRFARTWEEYFNDLEAIPADDDVAF